MPSIGAPIGPASSAFWQRWGDGKAELSGYRAISPRYGAGRVAEIALIYVTEPLDRRTRIKDDGASDPVPVLKLNASEKFLTGIYPYSIMTSVFCPADRYAGERFSPVKLTLTAQEWCGHVALGLWPGPGGARMKGMSYFASEGDVDTVLPVPDGALYEDALLVQLRELDGPFAGGQAEWRGPLVPSLWGHRKAHQPLAVVDARISRRDASDDRIQFELAHGDVRRTFEIERGGDRRVMGWSGNDGTRARIARTARLAYWAMNRPGDEEAREEMGLDPAGGILPFE